MKERERERIMKSSKKLKNFANEVGTIKKI
jgi:hypothetical protein